MRQVGFIFDDETTPARHTYHMSGYTEDTLREWTEQEYRKTVGASPRCEVKEKNEYDPRGPHRWFAEVLAEIAAVIAMRRMAETKSPPFPDWQSYAPRLRQRADEWITTAQLLPGITLAEWFAENEVLLQQDPTMRERKLVVVVALLPLFEQHPDCWDATEQLNDDTHGTFAGYLQDWYARVPEQHRPFVQRIAGEFGIEIKEESQVLKDAEDTTAK
jgi:hypothetical protein